jgi:hypothetical protein
MLLMRTMLLMSTMLLMHTKYVGSTLAWSCLVCKTKNRIDHEHITDSTHATIAMAKHYLRNGDARPIKLEQ